jgi:hypothetical protein
MRQGPLAACHFMRPFPIAPWVGAAFFHWGVPAHIVLSMSPKIAGAVALSATSPRPYATLRACGLFAAIANARICACRGICSGIEMTIAKIEFPNTMLRLNNPQHGG